MKERWLPIPGLAAYEVSDQGRFRRAGPSARFPERYPAGSSIKPVVARNGYEYVYLRDGAKKVALRVNRVVALAFLGAPPTAQHQAAHNDGDRLNNQLSNLRWAEPIENHADKVPHGTAPRGSRNSQAKLTEADAAAIRATSRSERSIDVGSRFGVSRQTVADIRAGRTWGQSHGLG